MKQRRDFLKYTGLGLGSLFLGSRGAARAAGPRAKDKRILVLVFQRGGMDGLMAVPPANDPNLRRLRPGLTMSLEGKKGESLLPLGDQFALHPALAGLAPLFKRKELAVIHGVGLPQAERSHFDAQDYMETATPGRKGTPSGWLNRLLAYYGADGSAFRALALSSTLPRSLYGMFEALAIEDVAAFAREGGPGGPVTAFTDIYGQGAHDLLQETGKRGFDSLNALSNVDLELRTSGTYPRTSLGRSLFQLARLIDADLGVNLAFVPSTGWDTHNGQGTFRGAFSRAGRDLGQSISAFWKDIEAHRDRVLLLTMTEFGRTVAENGSGGTDHGRGSCFFALGSRVSGGQVYGQVPRLVKSNLEQGRDLPVSVDFRQVLAEITRKHLSINYDHRLFPGWSGKPLSFMTT